MLKHKQYKELQVKNQIVCFKVKKICADRHYQVLEIIKDC